MTCPLTYVVHIAHLSATHSRGSLLLNLGNIDCKDLYSACVIVLGWVAVRHIREIEFVSIISVRQTEKQTFFQSTFSRFRHGRNKWHKIPHLYGYVWAPAVTAKEPLSLAIGRSGMYVMGVICENGGEFVRDDEDPRAYERIGSRDSLIFGDETRDVRCSVAVFSFLNSTCRRRKTCTYLHTSLFNGSFYFYIF